jgi:ERCC4-related helicase
MLSGRNTKCPLLRKYQARIAQAAIEQNVIVKLDTGAGKTRIAAHAIHKLLSATPASRAIFFVPKILLVEQQARAITEATGMQCAQFHGGLVAPKISDDWRVLVSTPDAYSQSPGLPHITQFCCVVFDEIHHSIKGDKYRKIAKKLDQTNQRVIGLTASLSYGITAAQLDESMNRICREYGIDTIETATQEEMVADGYAGGAGDVEVNNAPVCPELRSLLVPEGKRKPNLLIETFWARVDAHQATPFTHALLASIQSCEASIPMFKSPLRKKPPSSWGKYAHGLKHTFLEQSYEALRILVSSWEEDEDTAKLFLRMAISSNLLKAVPPGLEGKVGGPYSRFEHLKSVLLDLKINRHTDPRFIVFVEKRVMTHIIKYFVEQDPLLASHFKVAHVYATNANATESLRITKGESKQHLEDFRAGRANLLVATSVAEEGMDVPEANGIIRFDAAKTPVQQVQSRGRGREEGSSCIALAEQSGRTVATLTAMEILQQQRAQAFTRMTGEEERAAQEKERQKQKSREDGAKAGLAAPTPPVAKLNLFAKKTKVTIEESYEKTKGGNWTCMLKYESGRVVESGMGEGPVKKRAKVFAAESLIARLTAAYRTTN